MAQGVARCLVRLRKELVAGAIGSRPHRYCLVVPADEVDACRFERLVARAQELLMLGEPDRAAYVVDEPLGPVAGPRAGEPGPVGARTGDGGAAGGAATDAAGKEPM
jgi:hypothetical protein